MSSVRLITDIEDIAALIRASRKKQGLTQEDLAGLSNTGARFIVDLEKAKPSCQISKVLVVLRTLGIDLQVQDE